VECCPGGRTAGENESLQRRKLSFEPIDQALEPLDLGVAECRLRHACGNLLSGIGELGAQRKQVATSPYASTRPSALLTRVPPKSDVSPVSPVRV
jgi:hypothetical protein